VKKNASATHETIQHTFDLLDVRRKALKLAMVLFDNINDSDVLIHIGQELSQSAIATDRKLVEEAFLKLQEIAEEHDLPIGD
jgi:hypothetical protein